MEEKVLVTGAFGQIGSELVPALQERFGKDNVIALDLRIPEGFDGISEKADVLDSDALKSIIRRHKPTTIYHLVSLLSASGEKNPDFAWKLNMESLKNILDLAREGKMKVFWPSSIAAFGPTTPRDGTPQKTILEPSTMYGVTKVAGELLCSYYHSKYGVDVRSIRFPGVISFKAEPGGGTTDYACEMFYYAIWGKPYTCFVGSDTVLPMIYTDDAIRAAIMLMDSDPSRITVRTGYNLSGVSFSAKELEDEILKRMPSLRVEYKPDSRQKIADSWPRYIDDAKARQDWGWKPAFGLPQITDIMLKNLKIKLGG